jgi:hypothetical protein
VIALDAGIDPTAHPDDIITVSGFADRSSVRAYVHRVTLYLGPPFQFRTLTTEVAFVDPAVPLRTSVLGHQGFLDRVRFGIDGTSLSPCLYFGFE